MGKDSGCKIGFWVYCGSKIEGIPEKQICDLYVYHEYEKPDSKIPYAGDQGPAY